MQNSAQTIPNDNPIILLQNNANPIVTFKSSTSKDDLSTAIEKAKTLSLKIDMCMEVKAEEAMNTSMFSLAAVIKQNAKNITTLTIDPVTANLNSSKENKASLADTLHTAHWASAVFSEVLNGPEDSDLRLALPKNVNEIVTWDLNTPQQTTPEHLIKQSFSDAAVLYSSTEYKNIAFF